MLDCLSCFSREFYTFGASAPVTRDISTQLLSENEASSSWGRGYVRLLLYASIPTDFVCMYVRFGCVSNLFVRKKWTFDEVVKLNRMVARSQGPRKYDDRCRGEKKFYWNFSCYFYIIHLTCVMVEIGVCVGK